MPSSPASPRRRRLQKALATLPLALAALSGQAEAGTMATIETMATSNTLIWNGVVASGRHLLVSGPRWTASHGPAVARIVGQTPVPYPDTHWNSWRPGADGSDQFVDVNAIHEDGHGAVYVVDTGAPTFGGNPIPKGAKLVKINLATDHVTRIYYFGDDVALPGSYVDDVRFHGRFAYLTDAGRPGLIVLDLATGKARRVLDQDPSATARVNRPIVVDGAVLKSDGENPLRVNSDPMEVSPDGKWLYFGPLEGPWSRVPTQLLDDPSESPASLARHVRPWADIPPIGGSAMDSAGNLYFSDLAHDAIRKRSPAGIITTVTEDKRLHWVDALYLGNGGSLWMPATQLDRVALFHGGHSETRWPIGLYRLKLPPRR